MTGRPPSGRGILGWTLAEGLAESPRRDQTGRRVAQARWGAVLAAKRAERDSNSGCLRKSRVTDRCWDALSPPCLLSIRTALLCRPAGTARDPMVAGAVIHTRSARSRT